MIDVVKIGKAKPVKEVVDEARDFLKAAESGEIRQVYAVFFTADGSVVTMSAGAGEGDIYKSIGALHTMIHRIQRDTDNGVRSYNFPKGDNNAED